MVVNFFYSELKYKAGQLDKEMNKKSRRKSREQLWKYKNYILKTSTSGRSVVQHKWEAKAKQTFT